MRRKFPRLNILGASGHGKVVADIAKLLGYEDIVFYDDDISIVSCTGYPVLGTEDAMCTAEGRFFVAIGDPVIRRRVMKKYSNRNFPVLVHPNAVVAEGVKIGYGSAVMAGAVINSETKIGMGCIINTCASVDHDCKVEDYVHVAVDAHLSGTVEVGESTWIGTGAAVSNNINICGGCIIGAGAVVVKDIKEPGTYVGVPAKKIGNGGYV